MWDVALQKRLDRGVTFVALGGGGIGDMTGFAAACYQRGVHFVQARAAAGAAAPTVHAARSALIAQAPRRSPSLTLPSSFSPALQPLVTLQTPLPHTKPQKHALPPPLPPPPRKNGAQVPTTVMAQVDSSVGGKTGVNHPLGKNMVGAFYQPQAVLVDTDTLGSLPDRELASGISEIVKCAPRRAAPRPWGGMCLFFQLVF